MKNKKEKFPGYLQYNEMDCGPTCLKIIAKYYGKKYSLKFLRDNCQLTKDGVSLFDIALAAEKIGFHTLALKVNFTEFQNKMPLPLIIHWKQKHFVVAYKITQYDVYISDPKDGLITISHSKFKKACLTKDNQLCIVVFEPTPAFYTQRNVELPSSVEFNSKIN